MKHQKPERNKPCSCNSGIKFKRCCGDAKKISEKQNADHAAFMVKLEERAKEQEAAAKQGRAESRNFRRGGGIEAGLVMAMVGMLGGGYRR